MIENNRCPKCKYVYEVSWDDEDDKYYCDDEEDFEDLEREELYPEYCPFCGTYRIYGTEDDSRDDEI
jgi:hypothetical protein